MNWKKFTGWVVVGALIGIIAIWLPLEWDIPPWLWKGTLWIFFTPIVMAILTGLMITWWRRGRPVPNISRRIVSWLIFIIVVLLLIWGFTSSWGKKTQTTAIASGITVIQPVEEWTLTWRMKSGDTEQGVNHHTLKVKISKCDKVSFEAVLHDTNGHGIDERVGDLTLNWLNGDMIGTWSNYLDGDGGKCELYKGVDGFWSGDWEHKDRTTTHIELKRESK